MNTGDWVNTVQPLTFCGCIHVGCNSARWTLCSLSSTHKCECCSLWQDAAFRDSFRAEIQHGFNEYVFIPICVVKHQKNEVLMWSQAPCTCPLPPARLTEPLLTSLPLWIFMLCLLARWYFHYGPTTVLIQNAHWSLLCSQVSLFSRFSFFFWCKTAKMCEGVNTCLVFQLLHLYFANYYRRYKIPCYI